MPNKIYSLAYFVSHPIQYQAPLLKLLSQEPDIDLHVYFLTDITKQSFQDPGFGKTINWDTPLLEGYKYTFIESTLSNDDFSLLNPKVSLLDINRALKSKKWDAVWIHGYNNFALLYIIWQTNNRHIPLFYRSDSTLLSSTSRLLKNIFLKRLIKKSHALLWTSTENKKYYKHYQAKNEQLYFTPHAVNNDFFQSYKIDDPTITDKCILLFASKFLQRKNAPLLLDAFNQLKPATHNMAELWFVGDGEDKSLLENKIQTYGLQKQVSLLGFKNQTELASVLAQCDVFILPSSKEPFGLIINEAMNLGKPIITTDEVGAAHDLVKHKENGWIVSAGSVSDLREALSEAISNRKKLKEMGKISLAKINKWSYEENIKGIRQALKSLA